jgi:phosphoribosylformimino-5-aminoimidazole carboxamide ribotide isomerase
VLVIPAIEIENHRCYRTIQTTGGDAYPNEPAETARLWRTENAKSLHVTDYDGLYGGRLDNLEEILSIVETIEIPVMLLARCADVEECRRWLDGGVYRIVVHDLLVRDPDGVRSLLADYGGSRVIAGAITRGGYLTDTWRASEPLDTLAFAARAKEVGCRRIFFTDRDYEGVMRGPNFDELSRLAAGTDLPITSAGGVATVEHLWRLQELEPMGIDSVVIGRAFYENSFPCQQLWRDVELERRRDHPGSEEAVSTSGLKK